MIQSEKQKQKYWKRVKKNRVIYRTTITWANTRIMEVLQGRVGDTECLYKEIMEKNFPNLGKQVDIRIHEIQKTPKRINHEKSILKQIIIKLSKCKQEENFESFEGNIFIAYKGPPIRLWDYFSAEILLARRSGRTDSKCWKKKNKKQKPANQKYYIS